MANPLEVAVQATGKVRKFQLLTSSVLLVSLPIVWAILFLVVMFTSYIQH